MAASRTAQYVALYRALEMLERHREPLFRDPFAGAFVSPSLSLALAAARIPVLHAALSRYADRRAPGARTSAIARTRLIDDLVRERTAAGVAQLMLLGAGFDCRAHRMGELAATRVFEVDREATQEAKRAALRGLAHRVRDDVRYVSVDLLCDDVGERLAAAGWDRSRATLFVWEGVTNYLKEDAVARVLSWVGSTARGSTIVFTYVHAGLLDGSIAFAGGDRIRQNVRRLGEPWTFGLHPDRVAAYLASFGLALREDLGADEYRRRYLARSEPGLRGYGFYRAAVAQVS